MGPTTRSSPGLRQGVDDAARVHQPAGRPPAQSGRPALAEGRPRPPHRRAEEADLLRGHPEVLPRSRGRDAAGQGADHRQDRRRARSHGRRSSARKTSIRNLDTTASYLGQLADPRTITDAAGARQIIAKAKPLYHLSGGLHSGEAGPPEMLMELAYRLAVGRLADHQPDPRQRDRLDHAGRRPGRPRPLRRLVLPLRHQRDRRAADRRRRAVLGQVRLPRQQPRHQLLAGDDAGAARLVPAVAPADHARPARVADRSSTPSAARRRRTRTSIRSSTASCRCSRTSRCRR